MTTVAGIDLNILFSALNSELMRLGVAHTDLCVIGGSALNAVGLVMRPTRDVDIVALGTRDGTQFVLSKSHPLPDYLNAAAEAVAAQFVIDAGWLNAGPADLLDHGLPDGFAERLIPEDYGYALTVHYAGRLDQICFKTFAAADVSGRHLTDLVALAPTDDEVRFAVSWIAQQDTLDGFRPQLIELLDYLEVPHAIDGF